MRKTGSDDDQATVVTSGGPLDGLLVMELGQYISAPFAGKQLADLGADVIKIETSDGDPMRRWEGAESGMSPQFAAYNRNKSSVVLDLKDSAGRDELIALASRADVFIENFRPGVAERLGIDWPQLHVVNPQLIYCSVSGFGSSGPYVDRPAFDTVISAITGLYSTFMAQDAPRPAGPAFSDLLAGMSASQAILAALYRRQRSGRGERIEVSMLGAALDFLAEAVGTYLSADQLPQPDSRSRRAQAYALVASDGLPFVVHMSVPEKFWFGLVDAFHRPDLADDPRFATRALRVQNYDALDVELKSEALTRPRAEWLAVLASNGIPNAPLNTVAEAVEDVQVRHLGILTPSVGGDVIARNSVTFLSGVRATYTPAPRLGESHKGGSSRTAASDEMGLPQ